VCVREEEDVINSRRASLRVSSSGVGEARGLPTSAGRVWGFGGQGLCSVSEAGSYLRLIDSCITQLTAQGPSRSYNESKGEKEGRRARYETSRITWNVAVPRRARI